jgi:hypothetical protein
MLVVGFGAAVLARPKGVCRDRDGERLSVEGEVVPLLAGLAAVLAGHRALEEEAGAGWQERAAAQGHRRLRHRYLATEGRLVQVWVDVEVE